MQSSGWAGIQHKLDQDNASAPGETPETPQGEDSHQQDKESQSFDFERLASRTLRK